MAICFWKYERAELPLVVYDLLHAGGAQSPNELVLEIRATHVEPEPFHRLSRELDAESSSLEASPDNVRLAFVTQTGELHVEAGGTEAGDEAPDRVHTAGRKNGDAFES